MFRNLSRYQYALAALALAVCASAVVAARHPALRAAGAGRPEVTVTLAGAALRDNRTIPVEKAGEVKPGEVLSWTINSSNAGDGAAHEYKAVGQIPAGTVFVAGSAASAEPAAVTYSIDGGQTFSAQPTVEEQQADGTTRRVPAPVAAYTQVRYEWSEPLAAGREFSASYKVRVK